MSWSITEPLSALTVALVTTGDIVVEDHYATSVFYALRGTEPWVTDYPRHAPTITVPELVFRSRVNLDALRAIRDLSRRVELTDDMGTTWGCKFVGPLRYRILDTPGRVTDPIFYVTVALVGVT